MTRRVAFGALVTYGLPFGKGKRWLNRGGVSNILFGGWTVDMTENTLSGIPLSVGYSGSPNKYLTTAAVNALVPISQVNTPNWTMGQRFPTAAQTPYFNMSAFAYRPPIQSVRWARMSCRPQRSCGSSVLPPRLDSP